MANIAPNKPKYSDGVVTSDRVNVLKGPGTRYGVVKALRKGEHVTIYEEKSGWYRIGTYQWVSATHIKK
ncbi:SH3 domain-containing protein [Proteiniclasticum ruminis]|uniref:SH3 domain-containing protein n=1 Tax=Proteiniclasticum ruminis TaxID=398199 RepID=UPI0009E0266C